MVAVAAAGRASTAVAVAPAQNAAAGGGGSSYGGSIAATSSTTPSVVFTAGAAAPAHISLSLSPPSLVANGSQTSTATATVTDANGHPVSGDAVAFSTDGGQQIGSVTGHGDGTYTATITATTKTGTSTITATDGSLSNTAVLTQTPGPAARVSVALSPSSITADGTSTSTATATVTDAQGNAVAGDAVNFSSSGGQKVSATKGNGDGTYTATITATTKAGTSTITATDGSISASATLTQTPGAGSGGPGGSSAPGGSSGPGAGGAPSAVSPPRISGTARQGQTLTEAHGDWTGAPTSYAYQWVDCDPAGSHCDAIPGATSQSYTLQRSDVGHTLRVVETATNFVGSAKETSDLTAVVAAATPTVVSIATKGHVSRAGASVDDGIRLSCPASRASCSAVVEATVLIGADGAPVAPDTKGSHAAHRVPVGKARLTVAPGRSRELTFRLNHFGQVLLADHRHLPLEVKITGRQDGRYTDATKTIVLDGQAAHFRVAAIQTHPDGTISLRIHVSAPGELAILLTAWQDNGVSSAPLLTPARGRFVIARATGSPKEAGTLTLLLRPDAMGRRLITQASHDVTLRLWVSYRPLDVMKAQAGYYGLNPGGGCTHCERRAWPPDTVAAR
jgi:hypothetical protein